MMATCWTAAFSSNEMIPLPDTAFENFPFQSLKVCECSTTWYWFDSWIVNNDFQCSIIPGTGKWSFYAGHKTRENWNRWTEELNGFNIRFPRYFGICILNVVMFIVAKIMNLIFEKMKFLFRAIPRPISNAGTMDERRLVFSLTILCS